MNDNTEYVVMGKITTAFGIQGWVRIHSFTDSPADIFEYKPWYIKSNQGWQQSKVLKWKNQSKGLVALLENCDDRDKALALRQAEIAVPADAIQTQHEGEHLWRDLIGCRVVNQQKEDLGLVTKMMETGANDVLVLDIDEQALALKSPKGEALKERLVPYVPDEVILEVDVDNKLITVEWPGDF